MGWSNLFRNKLDDQSQAHLFLIAPGDDRALSKLDPKKPQELAERQRINASQVLASWLIIHASYCFEAAAKTHKDAADKTGEGSLQMDITITPDPQKPWETEEIENVNFVRLCCPVKGLYADDERFGEDKELPLSPIGSYVRKEVFVPIFKILHAREQHDSMAITDAIQKAKKLLDTLPAALNKKFDELGYTASEKTLHIPRLVDEARAAFLIVTSPTLLTRDDALAQIKRERER